MSIVHFPMLFLDGVYFDGANGPSIRFRWVRASRSAELAQLSHTIARRIGRYLERRGLVERDAENSYLAADGVQAGALDELLGHAITYRIAVGPHAGRKVSTLQTVPSCNEPFDAAWARWLNYSGHPALRPSGNLRLSCHS